MFNRKNEVLIDKKIVYGHSFAIYALSTYATTFDDPIALIKPKSVCDYCKSMQQRLLSVAIGKCLNVTGLWLLVVVEEEIGKRYDVHMHLMEALLLYIKQAERHSSEKIRRNHQSYYTNILHPIHKTGNPQFHCDWTIAPQIKFDVIWGWDRFADESGKNPMH